MVFLPGEGLHDPESPVGSGENIQGQENCGQDTAGEPTVVLLSRIDFSFPDGRHGGGTNWKAVLHGKYLDIIQVDHRNPFIHKPVYDRIDLACGMRFGTDQPGIQLPLIRVLSS